MEITVRSLWTLIHGMGFGAFYLLAGTGALIELYRFAMPASNMLPTPGVERFIRVYLIAMVVLAWLAVLSGTFIVYPWYRAAVPPGTTDLSGYPQKLLMSTPHTIGWHTLGMEWKEHVAWFCPFTITMVAYTFIRYGKQLRHHPRLRTAMLAFTFVSLVSAGIAGSFGAMINKYAPIQGGNTIHLSEGEAR